MRPPPYCGQFFRSEVAISPLPTIAHLTHAGPIPVTSFSFQDFLEEEELLGDTKDKQTLPKEEEEAGDPNSLLGSHRALYGADCELLVDQFQLHSQVYKKHQMALLEVSLFGI